MAKVSMVMFDLSGTTVYDEGYVTDCLYQAALEVGITTPREEIARNIGTNKRHLFQFLIARSRGASVSLGQMGQMNGTAGLDEESLRLADEAFDRYSRIMIELYHKNVREVSGAEKTFKRLH